ncbi:MAG: DNA gyrase modulator, partial [Pseudomonadota bacterium]
MSTNLLTLARKSLLEPAGLGETELMRLIGQLMSGSVDYADLYFQYSRHESWSLEEGKVKSGSHSIEQGVGVRACAGEKTGFAYSDEIVLPALLEAAGAARAIVQQGAPARVPVAFRGEAGRQLYRPDDPLASLADEAKVKLLERVEREARAQDPRVKQVMASLAS